MQALSALQIVAAKQRHRHKVVTLYRSLLRHSQRAPDPVVRAYLWWEVRRQFRRNTQLQSPRAVRAAVFEALHARSSLQQAIAGNSAYYGRVAGLAYGQAGLLQRVIANRIVKECCSVTRRTEPRMFGTLPPALEHVVSLAVSDLTQEVARVMAESEHKLGSIPPQVLAGLLAPGKYMPPAAFYDDPKQWDSHPPSEATPSVQLLRANHMARLPRRQQQLYARVQLPPLVCLNQLLPDGRICLMQTSASLPVRSATLLTHPPT